MSGRTLTTDSLEAVVVHSDLRRTGHFACSDDLLNQLHANTVWGLRGNFLDVPSDCPQRDERLGWTGDIAAFAPSAAFLYDVDDFLRDWLVDLALEQQAQDGLVPFVVPDALKYEEHPTEFPPPETAAIWSDAAAWVPWALWQAYGDRRVLEDQYASMAAHLTRVESLLSPSGLWDTGFQFGDWLDPQAPPDRPFESRAHSGVVATACAYRTARIVAESAALTGREDDAVRFHAWPSVCARRSTTTTCWPTAPSPAMPRRSTPWPLRSTCSTKPTGPARATGWPSSSRRTATTSPPASPARRS